MSKQEKDDLPITAARRGDEDAWKALFQRFRWPLYVFLSESIKDEQIALDLLQESFIRAHSHLDTLQFDHKFGSWLFGIGRQLTLLHLRKKQPWFDSEDELLEEQHDNSNDPLGVLMVEEQLKQCLDALDDLSFHHREVSVLFYLQEFKLEQIAEITNVSVGTIKSRLHFARIALHKILTRKNHEITPRTID